MKKRNKLSYWILSITIITATIISCNKKYEGDENSIEVIRNANNNGTYSKTKLDSLQAINLITTQKSGKFLIANINKETLEQIKDFIDLK